VAPVKIVRDSWGSVSLHQLGAPEALVEREIPHESTPDGVFQTLILPFETDGATPVEIRATGADAELFLDSALLLPLDQAQPFLETAPAAPVRDAR
jgi:hypothetical protein